MPEDSQALNVMIDVSPSQSHQGTSLASCLSPLLRAVGRPEWTMERLQGVLGHAFQFDMNEGGKHVNHDHFDWGPALDILPQIAEFQAYEASKDDRGVDLAAFKREVRDAIRAGLKGGAPALVWSPVTQEMRDNRQFAVCWGLIVGYNDAEETYTVRHPFVGGTYAMRYDALGETEPDESIMVKIYAGPTGANEQEMHRTALRNAVAYAHGTRYEAGDERNANRRATPHGFAAYETWRKAFAAEDVPTDVSHHHVAILMWRRRAAPLYLRELAAFFPDAAAQFEAAATHYERELGALVVLHGLCDTACDRQAWRAADRTEAGKSISKALRAERKAVANIKAALAVIDR